MRPNFPGLPAYHVSPLASPEKVPFWGRVLASDLTAFWITVLATAHLVGAAQWSYFLGTHQLPSVQQAGRLWHLPFSLCLGPPTISFRSTMNLPTFWVKPQQREDHKDREPGTGSPNACHTCSERRCLSCFQGGVWGKKTIERKS